VEVRSSLSVSEVRPASSTQRVSDSHGYIERLSGREREREREREGKVIDRKNRSSTLSLAIYLYIEFWDT
jgi:hypothetical protein